MGRSNWYLSNYDRKSDNALGIPSANLCFLMGKLLGGYLLKHETHGP